MKKFNFLLIFKLLGLLSINVNCSKYKLSEKQQIGHDSLLNDAKWELYKHNVGASKSLSWEKYILCNNKLMPFINYDIGVPKIFIVLDTIRFFFSMENPNCRNQLLKGPPVGAAFMRADSSYWTPLDGIIYVSNKKQRICSDDLCFDTFKKEDILFAEYIETNKDSITNPWLLSYYNNVIKKRIDKKQ